jgi:pimeloyl-ACP methyl ester carboxylesterase
MAERCPITFRAQVHPSCSWRALATAAPTGRHRSLPFSSAFQVVTFDHRGVGASEGQPPYNVEQWAADTLRLIDHLGLDRVHLVGHSTRGTIAQVLAADHSDRVASLVLGATWARLDARLRKLFVFRLPPQPR